MENANEIYNMIGSGKKSPGQWLALKTTKAFMKATKTKYKKDDDVYMMDEDLLKEYECYLKDEETKEDKEESSLMWNYTLLKLDETFANKVSDLFIQRVFGLSYSKIGQQSKISKHKLLDIMNDDVKELYRMAISHIHLSCKLHKVMTPSLVEENLISFMLFAEKSGLRALYRTIAEDDTCKITYGKVAMK